MRALSLSPLHPWVLMIASMSRSTALCVKCSRWNSWHTAFLFCLHEGSQLLAGLLSLPLVSSRSPSPVTSVSRRPSLHYAALPGLCCCLLVLCTLAQSTSQLSGTLSAVKPGGKAFLTVACAGRHLSGVLRPVSEVSCPREARAMQEGRLPRVSHFQTGSSGHHRNMSE